MDIYAKYEDMLGMMLDGIQSPTIRYQEWRRKKMNDGKDRIRIVDVEKKKDELIEMMKETQRIRYPYPQR